GSHGSTYGGNPMAMAIGNAVLDVVLEEGFLDHVNQMSLLLSQKLAGLTDEFPDMLSGVRGKGLMLGLECKVANTELQAACVANDLLVVAAGDNIVRLLPPLTITADDVSEAVARIEAACRQLRSSSASN
ncbi:MAG: aminotransferase class III-fold pyridoxal phosphate-dependent enzyme, partial [Anderseniella sp.]|nr:aminotransferase class III-fold pyridoxal phosphate-dependent enzyme [Anderseniella sp.]